MAWIWVFSSVQSTAAASGRFRYSLAISRTFSTNWGSGETLSASTRWEEPSIINAEPAPLSVKWTGDPRKLAFEKESHPRYIIAMALAPGSTNPGPIGLDLVARSDPNLAGGFVFCLVRGNTRRGCFHYIGGLGPMVGVR